MDRMVGPSARSVIVARTARYDEIGHGLVEPEVAGSRPCATIDGEELARLAGWMSGLDRNHARRRGLSIWGPVGVSLAWGRPFKLRLGRPLLIVVSVAHQRASSGRVRPSSRASCTSLARNERTLSRSTMRSPLGRWSWVSPAMRKRVVSEFAPR